MTFDMYNKINKEINEEGTVYLILTGWTATGSQVKIPNLQAGQQSDLQLGLPAEK